MASRGAKRLPDRSPVAGGSGTFGFVPGSTQVYPRHVGFRRSAGTLSTRAPTERFRIERDNPAHVYTAPLGHYHHYYAIAECGPNPDGVSGPRRYLQGCTQREMEGDRTDGNRWGNRFEPTGLAR